MLMLSSCSGKKYDGDMGSAWRIDRPSVIVSVFVSDSDTKWKGADRKIKEDCLNRLKDACAYLEEQTSEYSDGCRFTCDWEENPDLYYEASFPGSLVSDSSMRFKAHSSFAEENIPTEALKKKFDAQNIVYMFFYNTPYSNKVRSRTHRDDAFYEGGKFMPEMPTIYYRVTSENTGYSYITYRQSYAHEIMHCFGAPDLYYANEYIPQKYVDYMKETNAEDIMYRLPQEDEWFDFTELDAYYLGLTDKCSDVEKFGLRKSDFIDPGI